MSHYSSDNYQEYTYDTAHYVKTEYGKILKYISDKEALRLTKIILAKGLKRFAQFLKDNHFYKEYNLLKSQRIPLICWEIMELNVLGETIYDSPKKSYTIKMNTCYLYSSDAFIFLETTLLHELGHFICCLLMRDPEHDRRFKSVCKIISETDNDSISSSAYFDVPEIFEICERENKKITFY